MKNFIIGTAGHIDHGKTSLIRALTGRDTDRLEEEKRRGITIDLGFTYFTLTNGDQAGIIDVPGHEKFIKNMLAGVGGMDMVMMVIAADEGIMPQTREHLDILSILNIRQGIIVLTKIDMVEPDWLEMVIEEIREEMGGTFLQDAPIMPISSLTGEGIESLKFEITRFAEKTSVKSTETAMRLAVDRVFTIGGFGTVVTGTQVEGVLNIGEEVTIYPVGKTAKIRNLQVHGNNVSTSYAGQRVAINLSNIKRNELERGCVLAEKDTMEETMMLDVRLDLLKSTDRELLNRTRVRLYQGTSEILCRVILLDREQLQAGESCYAQLRLEEKTAVKVKDYFVLRFYSPMETIGGGIILDPNPLKRKRFDTESLQDLQMIEKGAAIDIMEYFIKKYKDDYHSIDQIFYRVGTSVKEAEQNLNQLVADNKAVMLTRDWIVHYTVIAMLEKKLSSILNRYHEQNPLKTGMSKEELRSKMYAGKPKSADAVIQYFLSCGVLRITDQTIALSEFKVHYTSSQIKLKEQLEEIYFGNRYTVPSNAELVKQFKNQQEVLQVQQSMVEEGILVKIESQVCLHVDYYQKALIELKNFIEKNGTITIAEFRDLIDTSRKYALLILEYFDKEKITKKIEDARILYTN